MTISSTSNRLEYTATSGQTVFPYTFMILADSDLQVYHKGTLLTLTTHYTVSGAGDAGGGNVTLVTGAAVSDAIVILRVMPLTQTTDYVENDPFPADSTEDALDKLTMISQQLKEDLGRTLLLATTSTYEDLTIPDPVSQNLLRWKTDLTGLENVAASSLAAGTVVGSANQIGVINSGGGITGNANYTIDAVNNRISFGGAGFNNLGFFITGSFTSGGAGTTSDAFNVATSLTGANGDTTHLTGARIQASITTQGNSETIGVVAQLRVDEPNITVGTGDTITDAATVFIAGAPSEGTRNHAILMDGEGSGVAVISSLRGMSFGIDANNNETTQFQWVNHSTDELMRLTDAGALLLGTTVTTNTGAGNFVAPNNTSYQAINGAGTSAIGLISLDTSNRMVLGPGSLAQSEVRLGTGTGANSRTLQFFEMSGDPGAGGANSARLYAKDNGSGKTQLAVQFNTGAIQVLATEP